MSRTRALLRGQFDLTWSLLEYHIDRLEPPDFLWEPTDLCWTVRHRDGRWRTDWSDTEPDPVPVPTIGWLTWHIGWWWGAAVEHAAQRIPPDRADVTWPGPGEATIAWLRSLRSQWITVLTEADMSTPVRFPWPDDPDKTTADMAAWVNMELMKNVAEIGQLRLLRSASTRR